MYNHQSSFDILTFAAVIPFEWKAVMKKEVLKMPFVGIVSKLGGHYFVFPGRFCGRHPGSKKNSVRD